MTAISGLHGGPASALIYTAPTPICGVRSTDDDERVLTEFLEASIRVPDLSLPPWKRFNFLQAPTPESYGVSSHALVSGNTDAVLVVVHHQVGHGHAAMLCFKCF